MSKINFKKGFSVVTIVLFIGASIIPTINGYSYESNLEENIREAKNNIEKSECYWWPMFKHDPAHIGFSESSAPETNNVKWTYKKSGEGKAPSVYDNKVYCCIGNNFVCLDASNGSEIWIDNDYLAFGSAVVDDRVYVSGFYYFGCFDADDGTLIWTYATGGIMTEAPVVADGKVFFGNDNKRVYCLNATNGYTKWVFYTEGVARCPPAYSNGRVYFGNHGKYFYCLNAENGSEIWKYEINNDVISSPAIVDGKVYFGGYDGKMHCLYEENGTEIWSFNIESGWIRSSPSVAYDNVYFAADDYHIYCLDANNGSKIWSYKTTYNNLHAPAVADDKVYVGTEYYSVEDFSYYIECLNAYNGSLIWRYKTNGAANPPAIATNKVYVCSKNGNVYCFGGDEPNLHCRGSFIWSDVEPGSTVYGNFIVENIGEPGTMLDWEITDWPEWGTWSFSQTNGEDLTPEDGPMYIEVEVIAPNEYNMDYSGTIDLRNTEDPCDYDEVDAFLSTIYISDLTCEGSIIFKDVKPGSTVNGIFYVSNSGKPGSELDWEVKKWPTWGENWQFNPIRGYGLEPDEGPVSIDVSFTAPDENEQEFIGEILIENQDDSSDNCTINVYIQTPRTKAFLDFLFLRILDRFPILERLLNLLR